MTAPSVWTSRPLVVGHRGGRGAGWPLENTIAAFDRARREGANAVELDVRSCSGGEVVVLHDATLTRTTAGADGRRVCDVGLGELRRLGVPTLGEALDWAAEHGVGVNVEMKHDVPSRRALACGTIRACRASGADVLLSSFDPALLAMVAALDAALPRALLVRAVQPLWARAVEAALRPPFAAALHLERTRVEPRAVARCARRGLRVGVWTVDDPAEAVALAGLGVGSIITDCPGAVTEALDRHSQSTRSTVMPGGTG